MNTFRRGIIATWMAVAVTGCMTSHYGHKIDASQISAIKKGVTTRTELERNLGSPVATRLLPDGRRMLHYTYNESRMKPETIASLGWIGGADMRRQNLQVIVGADDVVQDFDFTDNTGETKTGPFGTSSDQSEQPTNAGDRK